MKWNGAESQLKEANCMIAENRCQPKENQCKPVHSNCAPSENRCQTLIQAPLDFDFVYKIEPRFLSTITKESLSNAEYITDIVEVRNQESIESFYNISITSFHDDNQLRFEEKSHNHVLSSGQKKLFSSMDCTSSFYITGNSKRTDPNKGTDILDTIVNYITVVPNKQASYQAGHHELIQYLKAYSLSDISIAKKDNIKPGKISFVVTKNGNINSVQLTASSGYSSIDDKMLELIQHIPGTWNIAENAQGEYVDQELTFFFGLLGC